MTDAETPSAPASASPPSESLAGLSALVTGGATGIGLECARRLVADGASVTWPGAARIGCASRSTSWHRARRLAPRWASPCAT